MGRSDLMRAFHYFFQRRDYTYTLQKEKDWKKTDKGKLSESVTWLRGRGEILGIPFFFFVYKKWNTEKNGKKVQQKVCISTKLQHTSRTAAQDVISAVSWIEEELGRKKSGIDVGWNSSKSFWLRHTHWTAWTDQSGGIESSGGTKLRENRKKEENNLLCVVCCCCWMDSSATARRLVRRRMGCWWFIL